MIVVTRWFITGATLRSVAIRIDRPTSGPSGGPITPAPTMTNGWWLMGSPRKGPRP
jgi:hypothetical protein